MAHYLKKAEAKGQISRALVLLKDAELILRASAVQTESESAVIAALYRSQKEVITALEMSQRDLDAS